MDRIYDLLKNVEESLKLQSAGTLLPVPTTNVEPSQDPNQKPPLNPALVDTENNNKELNKQKETIKKIQNSKPDNSASQPNGDSSVAKSKIKVGDRVKNIDATCNHYGSEGMVQSVDDVTDSSGCIVGYKTTNEGESWTVDQYLRKNEDQLTLIDSYDDYGLAQENETPEQELLEYKTDFYEMSVGSLKAIALHAKHILDSLDNPTVKENLTESWLQGKIAITEDYMSTIHDFVMYVAESDDSVSASDKPGLWENIRKKKEREGKDYKPAKPGDKDRPDPETWKKLTK